MPIPLIPFIAGGLFSGLTSLISFLSKHIAKRFLLIAAYVTALAFAFGVFYGAVSGLLSGISFILPPHFVEGARLFVPSNFTLCFTIVAGVRVAAWVYYWNVVVVRKKFSLL